MSNNLTDLLLWTSRQAAKALAISERKLWDLTNEGAIPCIRIGRAVRYDPGDIRSWIAFHNSSKASRCIGSFENMR